MLTGSMYPGSERSFSRDTKSNMSGSRQTLDDLESGGDFIRRHISSNRYQIEEMVSFLGLASIDEIIDKAVPENIISSEPLSLTSNYSERAVISYMRRMRERNKVYISMIGMGYYGTILPEVIKRNVLENPGWYTAYTPYQAGQPGPARGLPEFSADGHGPDRDVTCQCLLAG